MDEIKDLITNTAKQLFGTTVEHEVTRTNEQFGDFASNAALKLAKLAGKPPREIAGDLAKELRKTSDFYNVEVAGPGFINVTVADSMLFALVDTEPAQHFASKSVVAETNNPNPFKAMHIGHAFNSILGDTIANLIEAAGAEIHRVSYHGDVGAHVGRSMYSLLHFVNGNPAKLSEIPQSERNVFMAKMYVEGAKAYKENEDAKSAIDELAAQSFLLTDPVYKEVYETCKAWSFEQIDSIVLALGNKPIEKRYLESEADALGVKTVEQNTGTVFIESNGALMFPGSKYGSFDNVFVSSNGRGLYGARDLGLIQLKSRDFSPNKSYIVTAEEQKDYFKGVIKAAELCMPEHKDVTENISTGTVKLTTGKMSSRTGEVIDIEWLFEQIIQAIKDRNSEPTQDIVAGALRYQFLKVRIGSDVVFDVAEAASLQGNSGPYLQYSYARAFSILQKSNIQAVKPPELEKDERSLLRKISEYTEVQELATVELKPHHICTYLYELAQQFNRFYEANRIIGHQREAQRIYLVQLYTETLAAGLKLLGITPPESM